MSQYTLVGRVKTQAKRRVNKSWIFFNAEKMHVRLEFPQRSLQYRNDHKFVVVLRFGTIPLTSATRHPPSPQLRNNQNITLQKHSGSTRQWTMPCMHTFSQTWRIHPHYIWQYGQDINPQGETANVSQERSYGRTRQKDMVGSPQSEPSHVTLYLNE